MAPSLDAIVDIYLGRRPQPAASSSGPDMVQERSRSPTECRNPIPPSEEGEEPEAAASPVVATVVCEEVTGTTTVAATQQRPRRRTRRSQRRPQPTPEQQPTRPERQPTPVTRIRCPHIPRCPTLRWTEVKEAPICHPEAIERLQQNRGAAAANPQ
jgi:hypothetical protein